MRKAKFRIDDGIAYEGYTSGIGSPCFTKAVADSIMNEVNAIYHGLHGLMHYVAETDTYIFVPDDVIREYKGEDVQTVDGVQHLYPIAFRWEIAK